ncbi:MAG: BCCT family transporter, partial [Spirochaeta sp.]
PGEGETDSGWLAVDIHPWVFFTSAIVIIGSVVLAIVFQAYVDGLFEAIQNLVATYAGWFFILTMNIILIFVLVMMVGRYGDIRLGGSDAKPEFTNLGWFSMLFSAGMGIGLLFYSVAEPIFHYISSPLAEPGTTDAARRAMDVTFLHWGLHPWAIYTLVGLSLAFFSFNKGLPLSIRSVFYPVLGERIHGGIGNAIDILATVATLFGVATSLGLGVQQVNAGLDHLFGIGQTTMIQVILIAGITMLATWSVLAGLSAGIRRLSEINLVLAIVLCLFVLIVGPTIFILNAFGENLGHYLQYLPQLSTWNETYETSTWQHSWTVFYWGWWIAWSPFVGMFIARVSYGRTIREFIMGVMFVPTLITFAWLTIFGNSALNVELVGAGGIARAVQENIPVALFVLLENFPFAAVSSLLTVVVIITFFVTSSDSGSMVIDIITAGGNPDPPKLQRLFWALLEGAVAAALLVGGGLVALQTAAITTGLPFALVLIFMIFSLRKGLSGYTEGPGYSMPAYKHGHVFRTAASHPEPDLVHGHVSWLGKARVKEPKVREKPKPHDKKLQGTSRKAGESKKPGLGKRIKRLFGAGLVLTGKLSVVLLVTAGILGCTPQDSDEAAETGREARQFDRREQVIRLAYVDWSSEVASAHLIQAVLQERLGYRVELIETDAEGMWRMVSQGEADLLAGAWLPATHAEYMQQYGETLDNLGPNLSGARIGLVVPVSVPGRQTGEEARTGRDLVTITSIPQLMEHAGRFNGRIAGIESGAGIMTRAEEAMEAYDLQTRFRLVELDEQRMLERVNEAVRREEWIVFTGWSPHWIFERYNLRFLEDPESVFGGTERVHTIVRQGFSDEFPAAYAALQRMQWEPEELERLMIWIYEDDDDPYAQAQRWLRTHEQKVDDWLRDIE